MKRKLFYAILAICFMSIFKSESVDAAEGGIIVNGANIMQSPDQTVLCGNGTARYDAASKKLILENAAIHFV